MESAVLSVENSRDEPVAHNYVDGPNWTTSKLAGLPFLSSGGVSVVIKEDLVKNSVDTNSAYCKLYKDTKFSSMIFKIGELLLFKECLIYAGHSLFWDYLQIFFLIQIRHWIHFEFNLRTMWNHIPWSCGCKFIVIVIALFIYVSLLY